MLSIIKTAIITIVISFISGVLLDTYKNFAPRIVCSIGKGVPIRLSGKKIRAYTLTVRNISNKTIHDLTLNVQGHCDNLKVDDAKITRGLKFDDSNEDNIYCVNIPFLSKDDEFSVKLFVEKIQGVYKKPVVTLRSPENFKKIESEDQNGFMAALLNVPENIGHIFRKGSDNNDNSNNKKESSFNNKKVVAAIVSVILVIFVAVFGIQYYLDKNKIVDNEVKTNSSQKIDSSSTPSSNSSKNNEANKQATEKNNTSSNNNNSTSSEGGKSNTSSEAKSSTPSSSKSNQSVEKSKSESDEDTSNSKSQTNPSEEETKDKSTDSTSVDSGAGKGETKNSSESKTKGTTESKTQEEKSSNNESGESGTTSPAESKTN